ncbi:hypothetical protein BDF14DRAFT_1778843 [Spinellus fusiger]|nr:hypothetical protein BDF14DRAFT_1778843 [Spinellus fusiger]
MQTSALVLFLEARNKASHILLLLFLCLVLPLLRVTDVFSYVSPKDTPKDTLNHTDTAHVLIGQVLSTAGTPIRKNRQNNNE